MFRCNGHLVNTTENNEKKSKEKKCLWYVFHNFLHTYFHWLTKSTSSKDYKVIDQEYGPWKDSTWEKSKKAPLNNAN